jgi:nitroimidazol reductase NimA-like FMN-containing flavoprotein (pyridoxamine 5'-phosphate oxidase superfamily)
VSEVIKRRRNYSKIALSPEQARDFLDSQTWLRLATLDPKEQIWNLPTQFVRLDDSIFFDENPESVILQHIERTPNVCGVVDSGYSYDDLVGTIIQGDASLVEERQTIDQVIKSMTEKYKMLTNRPPVQDFSNRKFVEVKPYNDFEILSWNFGKGHL